MKVFIANFGKGNDLWPECLRRSTIATFDGEAAHRLWEVGDRKRYIEHALAHIKTIRGEAPTRAVASRWYGILETVNSTAGDTWVHREKDELWWTTSKPDDAAVEAASSSSAKGAAERAVEVHKPCEPWSDRNRRGGKLSWNALHPKAREFLFTEGTLQQLSPENAEYAQALIAGEDLSSWHRQAAWKAKEAKAGRSAGAVLDPRRKAIVIMAMTVETTVAGANGQTVERTMKNKELRFSRTDLEAYIDNLIAAQDGLCALSGVPLQYHGAEDDPERLCSLDRIDSDGHYEAGNLQVVCRFVNRWKNDGKDEEFRRLLDLVRESRF